LPVIQFRAMTDSFPYPLLSKVQLISEINRLYRLRIPFLFIINYKADQGYVIRKEELDENYIQFQFESQHRNAGSHCVEPEIVNPKKKELQWEINPLSLTDYQHKFSFVQRQIHLGNSFLVNLTQSTKVQTNLNLLEIYNQSSARYKVWIKNSLLVLSPETFVRIDDQIISSYPMKGTIDATILFAEEQILNDPKEMAEHATIVDLIRNDLSVVADNVEVKRYRYIETIKTNKQDLLQVSSEITGVLTGHYRNNPGDTLFAMLPAGSICGAPKAKTLEIIEHAEGYDRNFYSGVCGYFDGQNLDSGIMIRFIEQDGENMVFKSGGGITAQSELIKEYEELIQKIYVPVC